VKLQLNVQGKHKKCIIKNVLHVAMLGYNLLSVSAMEVHSMETQFRSGRCTIADKMQCIAAQRNGKGGIYVLTSSDLKLQVRSHARRVQTCRCGMPGSMWHARIGHASIEGIANMLKNNVVEGLTCNGTKIQNQICESCVSGNSHRLPFPPKSSNWANGILDLVHSDVCRPMPV
jgi:GAG-pre-integrase domain